MLNNSIERMLNKFIKIKNKIASFLIPKERNNLYQSLTQLSNNGFQPNTIFDVGVAKGTRDLYKAFPNSFFVLIEPLKNYNPFINRILKKYNGTHKLCALSDTNGIVKFNLHPEHMDGSSLLKEESGKEVDGFEVEIKTRKIDDIVLEEGFKGPFLIKIDVQGAELKVLNGGLETIKNTEVITMEVSLFKFMKGAPEFFEVIKFMKDKGFVVYDILKGFYRPLDKALGQVDIVFVREDGKFRKDHRFATKEQLQKMGFI